MSELESRNAFARLVFVVLVLTACATLAMFMQGSIPVLGELPGDFVFLLPSGEIYVPATSSVLVAGICIGIAYLISTSTRK